MIAFLPRTGPLEGGTFGSFKCGRQTQKRLLTTKRIGGLEVEYLLKRTLSDFHDGTVNGLSAAQCATQRLLDFDAHRESEHYEYEREMAEIFIVIYENEFLDRLVVSAPEPGHCGCAVL